jgi:hypothetical protein
MWWVWDAPIYPGPVFAGPFQGAYTARGTGGQFVTVLPFSDTVIVHTVDIDKNPRAEVSGENESTIRNMVLASICDGPSLKRNEIGYSHFRSTQVEVVAGCPFHDAD